MREHFATYQTYDFTTEVENTVKYRLAVSIHLLSRNMIFIQHSFAFLHTVRRRLAYLFLKVKMLSVRLYLAYLPISVPMSVFQCSSVLTACLTFFKVKMLPYLPSNVSAPTACLPFLKS